MPNVYYERDDDGGFIINTRCQCINHIRYHVDDREDDVVECDVCGLRFHAHTGEPVRDVIAK